MTPTNVIALFPTNDTVPAPHERRRRPRRPKLVQTSLAAEILDDTDEGIPDTRFPLDPVLDRYDGNGIPGLAAAAGVSVRTAQRWSQIGIDYFTADKIAVRALGVEPYIVWPELWR